jgi:hypothetical protein
VKSRELSRKLLTAGVVLAIVGIAFAVFSADLVVGFGVTSDQGELLNLISAISRVFMFFGLPLAAGFICLGIAFRHTAVFGELWTNMFEERKDESP